MKGISSVRDPYAVEETGYDARSDNSYVSGRKKIEGITGDIEADKKRILEIYNVLFFWAHDRGIRESRFLTKVEIVTQESYVTIRANFGAIVGMDVKPGRH